MTSPFDTVLSELGRGVVLDTLTEELAAIVLAVSESGKKGKLVLTVTVAPNGETVVLSGDVKSTRPRAPAPSSLFFTSADGSLHRHDPKQPSLPLPGGPGLRPVP